MKINNFVNNLKVKYDYEQEIIDALNKIIPEMINYYGSLYEDIILNAIESCPIYKCQSSEDIYDLILKNQKYKIAGETIVTDNDYKRASGVYFSEPILEKNNKNYAITDVNRFIGLSRYCDLNKNSGLGTLTHELGHLIKSYIDEYKIENNIITKRSGFITEKIEIIETEDKNTILKTIEERNVGLEEGINTHDEKNIMSNLINEEYKIGGYVILETAADLLFNKLQLKDNIRNAQFFSHENDLKIIYDGTTKENNWRNLNSLLDKVVKIEYERFANIFSPEKSQQLAKEREEIIKDIINNMKEYYNNNILKSDNNNIK